MAGIPKSAKKAQITVFIIIAVVLLFSTALVFYIRNQVKDYEPDIIEDIKDVPLELQPVKEYVESCMSSVSDNAIGLIGRQAGYIYLNNFDLISPAIDPNNADVLLLGSNQFMPYWFYQKRNGIDRLRIPNVKLGHAGDNSLEDQFNRYVNENLLNCINEFEQFKGENIKVEPQGSVSAQAKVNEDDVTIVVTYPLKVTIGTKATDMDKFIVRAPVRLGKIMRLAREITQKEVEDMFLEQATNKFISIYSGVDKSLLPPPGSTLRFVPCSSRVFWLYFDVIDDFRQMITANIPYIKIRNAEHDRIIITTDMEPNPENRRLRQAVFDNLIFSTGQGNYNNIRVDMSYTPDMPLDLFLGSYGLLEPSSAEINLIFSQLCMFDYKFYYDVKLPIVARITDSRSFVDGNQFVFEFPMQAVIKDNNPRIRLSELFELNLTLPLEEVPSYDCMPQYWDSGMINFTVLDSKTDEELEDVGIFFQCGPSTVYTYDAEGNVTNIVPFAEKCMIGGTGENGQLKTRLPSCYGGGLVSIRKNGYLEKAVIVGDILPGINRNIEFELSPLVEKKFKVMKYFVEPPIENDPDPGIVLDADGNVVECNIKGDAHETASFEDVMIRLEKIDPETGLYNGVPIIMYNVQEAGKINIAPGRYVFDMQLIRKERYVDELTIKARSQCQTINKGLFQGTETICYPEEDLLMPQIFTGGSQFIWQVSDNIYNDNEITFFVMDEGTPEKVEQIGQALNHLDKCYELNKATFTPRLR